MRAAALCLTFLSLLPASAATFDSGPWRWTYDQNGPQALSLAGQPLVLSTGFGSYQPGWKGANFALGAGQVRADDASVTWRWDKGVAGTVTLVVKADDERVTWTIDADVKPAGPCEFGLVLAAGPLLRRSGELTYVAGDQASTADAAVFPSFTVRDKLVFDRPEHTFTWECAASAGGWQLQDWRARPEKALRLIAVFEGGKGPVHLSATMRAKGYSAEEVAQRQVVLEQRTRWREAVEVKNAGFEDGPEGWSLSNTGAVVEEQPHGGRRCARLRVADPLKDAVYITRQVPIVPGGSYTVRCQVRTADVVARPGRMSSVGAGLIVEWADAQGKWLASGDYACELFGTKGWTLRECRTLRAPENAGFAVIFLALRAAGTAWFDDLEIERVHCAAALAVPLPGGTLADNRPTLAWQPDTAAARFEVDLSEDATFAPENTITGQTEDNTWQPAKRLAPGRWHWRVRAPGFEPSMVWTFTQTAPQDKDTTPPRVLTEFARVTAPDEPFRVEATDDTGGPVTLTPSLGGQTLRVTPQGVQPPGRWADGLNDVRVTATDAAGNKTQATVRLLCRPQPTEPVRILADGAYSSGGRRIFPFGIYQVSPAAMPKVKAAGFDVVHTYQFEGSQDDAAATTYLNTAHAAGLRVFIGFDRGNGSHKGLVQGNIEHVVQRVAALCGNPGLFCWYLFDEPEVPGQVVLPRLLIRYADTIRQLDPYHPVVVTTWGPNMARYRRSFDTHWTQAYTTPAGVVRQLAEHRGYLGAECPLTLLVHCYDQQQQAAHRHGAPFDPAKFQPDAQWLRAAAYAGVTQHINGLWWWFLNDTGRDWLTVGNVPWAWDALSKTVHELRELSPVLAAAEPDRRESVKVEGGLVEVWRRTVAGETTVIAVNTTENEVTVKVPLTGSGPAQVLFEGRSVERQNGMVEDRFGRYGVHVYRYR